MRLTTYTDYSLRVLMFLAVKNDRLATIAEIAKAYAISKNHLMKVVHQLGLAGYVETVRGKSGGLRLARLPQDIWLGEVVRRTEPDMTLVPCFDASDDSCAIFSGCVLRSALFEARDAFVTTLDKYTLADLVRPRASLRKILAVTTTGKAARQRMAQRA